MQVLRLAATLLALLASATAAQQQDWPTYLGDARRSAATDEQLPVELGLAWTHTSAHAPQPSWPAPAPGSFWQRLDDIQPRVVYDRAFHPVAVGEYVLFASSADDSVRCLDAATGRERWTFTSDGPVRFAPEVAEGRVHFASDDGHVYALELASGRLLWRQRVAPDERIIPGNGRLVSAWPPRTGVLVDKGTLYCTAGLFPGQGTWALALDAATGAPVWSVELDGRSPQGYLLASPERIYVPTGRAQPFALARSDGSELGSYGAPGGSYAVLLEEGLASGPGNTGQLQVFAPESAERLASYEAGRMAVRGGRSWLLSSSLVQALDRGERARLLGERAELAGRKRELARELRRGGAESLAQDLLALEERMRVLELELAACLLWSRAATHTLALALAGDDLFLGGEDEVLRLDAETGEERWRAQVDGRALSLAVARGRLYVATDSGVLHAFGDAGAPPVAWRVTPPPVEPGPLPHEAARLWIEQGGGVQRGLALLVGEPDELFLRALCELSELRFEIVVESRERLVATRTALERAGLHGARASVRLLEGERLPYADGIFNYVHEVAGSGLVVERLPPSELTRVLRPSGGALWSQSAPGSTSAEVRAGFTRSDPLPGSGRWTHAYADAGNRANSGDTRIQGELALRWFGGPGPGRMVDRHLRTAPPLAADGLLVIPGRDRLIGVDAYNGTELWEYHQPALSRTGVPYDGGYLAISGEVWAVRGPGAVGLDPLTGVERADVSLPRRDVQAQRHWGWLAAPELGALHGTAQSPEAARREQSRAEVVDQYSTGRPLVVSASLFRAGYAEGEPSWRAEGCFVDSAIGVAARRCFAVESEQPEALQAASLGGRASLATILGERSALVARDAITGDELWRAPFGPSEVTHSLYLACDAERVVLVGAGDQDGRNHYWVWAHDAASGALVWSADHTNNRGGVGGDHGEQVHHPVMTSEYVFAEPRAYHLDDGRPADFLGQGAFAIAARSGCGTLSACESSLFFRDRSPAVLEFGVDAAPRPLTSISRPGCWISVLPAGGLVLLPEASSGCVCAFPLQTSMAFAPVRPGEPPAVVERELQVAGSPVHLRECGPPEGAPLVLLHGGRFSSATWEELGTLELCGAAGLRAIALDLPGSGASPASSLAREEWLLAAFDALGLERAHLVSPSASGSFSMPFLATHPERVAGFVACAPVAIEPWLAPLADSPVPVLAFWADPDGTVPLAQGAALVEAVRDGRLVTIPGARHPSYLDAPERFHAELLDFVQR